MKAVVVTQFGDPNVLNYTTVSDAEMGPRQVLIHTAATSVNFADIKARRGGPGAARKLPFVPGLDVAGTVEAVGEEVQKFQAGQRVIAFPHNGSYAEYVVADAALTFPIPDSIAWETAAACPIVSLTAYKLLADVAQLASQESVLVHAAAGGVGTTAVQLAKILGASRVFGTVGSAAKVAAAKDAGCDEVLIYGGEDFAAQVNDLTNGNGVDVILDSVGGSVSEHSLDCLADYGRLVHFGSSSGGAGQIPVNQLHSTCRSVLGFSLGTTRKKRPHLLEDAARQVLTYIDEGQLRIKVGQRLRLHEAALGHQLVESRQSVGKIVLTV